jgi:phospholipid/cholesterol/gamma-HCH transport system substrate-binding protein
MRAIVPAALVLVLVATLAAFYFVSRDEEESYRVRAIFDNAGFLIEGEDVKVAGVKVGSIEAIDVTPDFKAAVVLAIDDPGYQDFRTDAKCIVRPQSLIGEKFVECEPTQRRGAGEEPPGELRVIEEGPGEGQRLLPVENTERSVDLDLLNNTLREPYRQRLSIIVNELGIGLAGRGEDLNDVIRRANPALKEVDELLRILARQNDQLESLAVDGDTIMQPLARERERVSSSIENMSAVAEATAERRADLEANFERLPTFLRELRPTMRRLGALSDEMTPVLSDLGEVAPDINRFLLELGPFSQAGIPALDSLGEAGVIGTPAVRNSIPIVKDLRSFARQARPVGETLADLLVSFRRNDGIERAMDYIFFQAAAVNGFDSFGHYLRAGLIVNQCSSYSDHPVTGCSANFSTASAASAARAASMPRDGARDRRGRTEVGRERERRGRGDARRRQQPRANGSPGPAATPAPEQQQQQQPAQAPAQAPPPQAAPPAPSATPAPPADDGGDAGVPLLDYLFGGDG